MQIANTLSPDATRLINLPPFNLYPSPTRLYLAFPLSLRRARAERQVRSFQKNYIAICRLNESSRVGLSSFELVSRELVGVFPGSAMFKLNTVAGTSVAADVKGILPCTSRAASLYSCLKATYARIYLKRYYGPRLRGTSARTPCISMHSLRRVSKKMQR